MRWIVCAFVVSIGQGSVGQELRAAVFSVGSLSSPTSVVQHPTEPRIQLVLQQNGVIFVMIDGVVQQTPFLTVPVEMFGGAAGLLGLCFDPQFSANGHLYVNYSAPGPFMRISRFTRSQLDPLKADPASEHFVFRSLRPHGDHNPGSIGFGRDGFLYIPTGDGGGHGDPDNRAQDPNDVLGKFLRLDVSGDDFPGDPEANYRIPWDNPFVDGVPVSARPEIWSFGTRNPWKWSFDDWTKLGTGAMVMADVGEDLREEINYEPFSKGGRNYGWSRFEGTAVFRADRALSFGPHTEPVFEVPHPTSLSITGGHVYRGLALGEESFGRYYFSDWVTGSLWSLRLTVDPVTGEAISSDFKDHTDELGQGLGMVVSIDVDADGELLVTDFVTGQVRKIWRQSSTWITDAGRADGVVTEGQVRSLIADDGKTLNIEPFSPFYTNLKRTTLVAGFKTNVAGGTTLQIAATGKVNQALNVPCTVRVKNWVSNQYDLVGTFNLTGTMAQNSLAVSAFSHVRSGDGRIELRLEALHSGPLLQPRFMTSWERLSLKVQ